MIPHIYVGEAQKNERIVLTVDANSHAAASRWFVARTDGWEVGAVTRYRAVPAVDAGSHARVGGPAVSEPESPEVTHTCS